MEPDFLVALDAAARCASRNQGRYAIHYVQLRGRDGAVIGTDGRQLLLQRGFRFPWSDNQHLLALPVFGGKDLPHDQPIQLGLTQEAITLEVGSWLFAFKPTEVRFPDVDAVMPKAEAARTRLQVAGEDVDALLQALPKLPAHDEQHQAVALELGKRIAVRACDEEGQTGEVLLPHCKVIGPRLRVVIDRRYLVQALQFGFTEILVTNAKTPLLCQDARRVYLWMPLTDDAAVARRNPARGLANGKENSAPVPTPDTVSSKEASVTAANPENPRRPTDMPSNDHKDNGTPERSESLDPITEAEAIRSLFQEAIARTNRLIAALKQQRRQSKVVETALASLRKLQPPER
jgi:hypothetical protein